MCEVKLNLCAVSSNPIRGNTCTDQWFCNKIQTGLFDTLLKNIITPPPRLNSISPSHIWYKLTPMVLSVSIPKHMHWYKNIYYDLLQTAFFNFFPIQTFRANLIFLWGKLCHTFWITQKKTVVICFIIIIIIITVFLQFASSTGGFQASPVF